MIRNSTRRVVKKNESVEDPRELFLSLVDLGSISAEEALLACVKEMSDAECKRVLNSISLPSCTEDCDEEPEEEVAVEVEEPEDDVVELDKEDLDDEAEDLDSFEDAEEEDVVPESLRQRRLERRVRRLEACLRNRRK